LLDELETGESRYPLPGFDPLEIPPVVAPGPGPANGRGKSKASRQGATP
jgi:hypothetical protein